MPERINLTADEQSRIARESWSPLKSIAAELLALADELVRNRVPYDPSNGADVMAGSFCIKQCEHLRSVQLLLDAKAHRDATVIARTMLEGETILRWAFANSPERTDQWFWFGAIIDWRQTLKNEATGRYVDPIEKSALRRYVDLHGERYFRRSVQDAKQKAVAAGAKFTVPVDPWSTRWTSMTVDAMANEIGFNDLYESFYRSSSEWTHWGIRGILYAQETPTSGLPDFSEDSWRRASQALAAGCQALLSSLEVLDRHFAMGESARLESPRIDLVNTLDTLLNRVITR